MPLCALPVPLYPVAIMGNPKKSKDLERAVESTDRHKNEWGLTPKQEAFCHSYIEEANASVAYRKCYDIGRATLPQTVWRSASELLENPLVTARVQSLREAADLKTICGIKDLMRDWYDIATADPRELVHVEKWNCRYCHGIDYAYQWIDENEWAERCARSIDDAGKEGKPAPRLPSFDGGSGFKLNAEPNVQCPHCCGQGQAHTFVADTSKLSTKARKLFKSAKENRYGEIVIEMHDQQKARESIGRMLGAFNDKMLIPGLGAGPRQKSADIPETASTEDAAKIYQQMVAGN